MKLQSTANRSLLSPLLGLSARLRSIPLMMRALYLLTAYIIGVSVYNLYWSMMARLVQGMPLGMGGDKSDPLYELGTSLGFWGLLYMLFGLLLATRLPLVDRLFGGMDRAYRAHGLLGKAAFVMIVLHLMILVVQAFPDQDLVSAYLVPGVDLSFTLGVFGTIGLVVLVTLTLWIAIPYGAWLITHRAMGGVFVLGGSHAAVAQGDWYLIAMTLLGGVAWLYTLWGYRRFGPGSRGTIAANRSIASINELVIDLERPLAIHPGQYVLFAVQTGRVPLEKTPHPFSVSHVIAPTRLRLSAKCVGDFTRRLHLLQPGDSVHIYGPYGRFGHDQVGFAGPRLWIAGGIGITPFLSMLHAEAAVPANDGLALHLIWSVRTPDDAVYHDEILALASAVPALRYHLHVSAQDGRLDHAVLVKLVGAETMSSARFYLCGPVPMLRTLTTQFARQGIEPQRIVYEEFTFR